MKASSSYIVLILILLTFSSCGEKSRRGQWTDTDKQAARAELEGIRQSIQSSMGSNSEKFISCYLETLENKYSNFEEASNDFDGRARLAMECTAAATPPVLGSK